MWRIFRLTFAALTAVGVNITFIWDIIGLVSEEMAVAVFCL